MALLREIGLLLAVSFLMLHTLLPHSHAEELSDNQHIEAHETAQSLLDYLQLAFHANPGKNHLEEFQIKANTELGHCFSVVHSQTLVIPFKQVIANYYPNPKDHLNQKPHHLSSLSFRGPPSVG